MQIRIPQNAKQKKTKNQNIVKSFKWSLHPPCNGPVDGLWRFGEEVEESKGVRRKCMAVTDEKKKKKGTFWSLEEVIGKKRRKKEKKKRSKGTCG